MGKNLLKRVLYREALPLLWRIRSGASGYPGKESVIREFKEGSETGDIAGALTKAVSSRFFFNPLNQKDFFLNILTRSQPHDDILREADRILQNEYDLLGSDSVHLESPIRWQFDFKSGKEWPLRRIRQHELLDLGSESDIKVPWELARFHQCWWLGKAYWLSRNREYALHFRSLVIDWIRENPPGQGVHWTTAMEVAIRACNWIAGLCFFADSDALSADFWESILASLLEHGIFLDHHLEYSDPSGNHLVGGLVGLLFLGILLRDTRCGARWLHKARRELEKEIQNEVYGDGVHFEKSVAYHRFVLEMFLYAYRLGELNRVPFSRSYEEKLKAMFDFVAACVSPDGSTPNIGDADDGRFFRFTSTESSTDHRSTLAVGAVLFRHPGWISLAQSFSQDALWILGAAGFEQFLQLRPPPSEKSNSKIFKEGGFAFLVSQREKIVVRTGDAGMTGKPGHCHSDTFSFEVWIDGEKILVDSGTYCYSGDVKARNWFRSAAAHNTLTVDGRDFIDYGGLWKVRKDETHPEIVHWSTTNDQDALELRRTLNKTLAHTRRFEFDKTTGLLIIRDLLSGGTYKTVERYLHFAPRVRVTQVSPLQIRAQGSKGAVNIIVDSGELTIGDTEYSDSYGRKTEKQTVKLRNNAPLEEEAVITIRAAS